MFSSLNENKSKISKMITSLPNQQTTLSLPINLASKVFRSSLTPPFASFRFHLGGMNFLSLHCLHYLQRNANINYISTRKLHIGILLHLKFITFFTSFPQPTSLKVVLYAILGFRRTNKPANYVLLLVPKTTTKS